MLTKFIKALCSINKDYQIIQFQTQHTQLDLESSDNFSWNTSSNLKPLIMAQPKQSDIMDSDALLGLFSMDTSGFVQDDSDGEEGINTLTPQECAARTEQIVAQVHQFNGYDPSKKSMKNVVKKPVVPITTQQTSSNKNPDTMAILFGADSDEKKSDSGEKGSEASDDIRVVDSTDLSQEEFEEQNKAIKEIKGDEILDFNEEESLTRTSMKPPLEAHPVELHSQNSDPLPEIKTTELIDYNLVSLPELMTKIKHQSIENANESYDLLKTGITQIFGESASLIFDSVEHILNDQIKFAMCRDALKYLGDDEPQVQLWFVHFGAYTTGLIHAYQAELAKALPGALATLETSLGESIVVSDTLSTSAACMSQIGSVFQISINKLLDDKDTHSAKLDNILGKLASMEGLLKDRACLDTSSELHVCGEKTHHVGLILDESFSGKLGHSKIPNYEYQFMIDGKGFVCLYDWDEDESRFNCVGVSSSLKNTLPLNIIMAWVLKSCCSARFIMNATTDIDTNSFKTIVGSCLIDQCIDELEQMGTKKPIPKADVENDPLNTKIIDIKSPSKALNDAVAIILKEAGVKIIPFHTP